MNDAEAALTRETAEDWNGPLPLTLRQSFAVCLLLVPIVVGAVLLLAGVAI
jgi:hypothetical protein